MRQTVAIGLQDFERIRRDNIFYIDKTDFIREWWEGGDAVTLICRPRRFGKTLNMDMLYKFFSVEYKDRGDLFEGLSIWENEKFRALQGTYPVIFLSFAGIKASTYQSARGGIIQLLIDVYVKYRNTIGEENLSAQDRAYFDYIKPDMSDDVAVIALNRLSAIMERHFGKKTLILLDEYDTPLQEAYVQGYWNELVSFTRGLFNSTFKTNPSMERAVMTGITRVSKESMFSDLNNLKVITTMSEKYMTCFGFTEPEVFKALDDYGLSDCKQNVKDWFDGFTFGNQRDIYNPWSIIGFLSEKKIGSYWSNTSSNSLAAKLLREGSSELKKQLEDLIDGKTIKVPIDEEIVFNRLDSKTPEAIWSLLLASGYLKVEEAPDCSDEETNELYTLSLTNREVRRTFKNMIIDWFKGSEAGEEYNEFVKAMLNGNLKMMNKFMNNVALKTFSYFDAGNKPSEQAEPERFYHGFVLGLIVELAGKYTVTSNRESGYGRYDVMIKPLDVKSGDPAFILEFKVHDPDDEKTLADTAAAALVQIEKKKYETALIAGGIPKDSIRKYGFAFEGQKVLIAGG